MKKIVMTPSGGFGDFVAGTVPVCNYLQDIYGECEFHFFMSPRNIGIAKYFFPNCKTYLLPEHNRFINYPKIARAHKDIQPDIGFSVMPNNPRFDSLFFYLIGCKERYGRIGKSIFAKVLLNHASPLYDNVDQTPEHVALCGIRLHDSSIMELDKKYYPHFKTEMLPVYTPKNQGPYILVEVSNNREYCQLSAEKTAEILHELAKNYHFSVLISGKEEHQGRAEKLQSLLTTPSEIFISEKLDEFLSFVNSADILLVGDGGLCHMAASMDKCVAAVFGKTSPGHWGPLGVKLTILFDSKHVNNIPNNDILELLNQYMQELH